jgi:hypothetical protein
MAPKSGSLYAAFGRPSLTATLPRSYFGRDRRAQARKDAREVAAINRHAAQLNSEMSDALTVQVNSADE